MKKLLKVLARLQAGALLVLILAQGLFLTFFNASPAVTFSDVEVNAASDSPQAVVETQPPAKQTVTVDAGAAGQTLGINDVQPRTTSRAIPSSGQVIYVSPWGSNSNGGTSGSPKQTLAGAYAAASPGATIVLRTGVYREQVSAMSAQPKRLIIQSYPGERVWMDGAVVIPTNEWVQDGSYWRKDNWTIDLQQNCYEPNIVATGSAAGLPDMLFIDGQPKTQALSMSGLGPGTFYVDTANQKLYIGNDPNGKTVEATKYAYSFKFLKNGGGDASGSEIHGVGFRRYGSHQRPSGSCFNPAQVVVNASNRNHPFNVKIKDSTFYYGAGAGMTVLNNTGTTIENVEFIENGFNGLQADQVNSFTVKSTTIANNNHAGFLIDTADGGATAQVAGSKITNANGVTISDNTIYANKGVGMWCDITCDNANIVRNRIYNNASHGFFYEISANANIASNIIYNNGESGLHIKGINIRIFNNTFYRNNQNLTVIEDARTGGIPYPRTDQITIKNNLFVDATAAKNNEFNQPARMVNLRGDHPSDQNGRSPAEFLSMMNNNVYIRTNASVPARLIGWQGGSAGATTAYNSLAAFRAALPLWETAAKAADGVGIGSVFVNAAGANFKLSSNALAINAGIPLSAAEAAAIGIKANSYVDAGALTGPGLSFTPTAPPASPVLPTPTPTEPTPGETPSDDPEGPDASNDDEPIVSIIQEGGSNSGQLKVTVTEEVCNNSERIEHSVNNEVVATGCEANIDTTKLPNGEHELKTTIVTKDGEVIEQTQKILVNNPKGVGKLFNSSIILRLGVAFSISAVLMAIAAFGFYRSGFAPRWYTKAVNQITHYAEQTIRSIHFPHFHHGV